MNVLYDPVTQTWRRNKIMDDMISALEQKTRRTEITMKFEIFLRVRNRAVPGIENFDGNTGRLCAAPQEEV